MDAVLRAAAIYLFLLLIFRIVGKRTLAQMTAFDFVLLLIIGESTEHALLADDRSVTHSFLLIVTLLGIDLGFSLWKQRSRKVEDAVDGIPVVLLANGQLIHEHLQKERVDQKDIMESARRYHGLERMDQIKYAVLEPGGGITVVPYPEARMPGFQQERQAA